MMRNKIRASLIHLLISFLLVSIVFALVLLVCYPNPYSSVTGARRLLGVLAGVDICLGPLITFIIFNPRKRQLKWELGTIAILQLSALTYGATTLFIGRPAYLVFNENQFVLVAAYQVPNVELKKAHQRFLPMTGPKIVGVRLPSNREQRKKYVSEVFEEHVDLPRMLQYYVPYEKMADNVKASMWSLEKWLQQLSPLKRSEAKMVLDGLANKGMRLEDLAGIALAERDTDLTVLVKRSDASIVDVIAIPPLHSSGD